MKMQDLQDQTDRINAELERQGMVARVVLDGAYGGYRLFLASVNKPGCVSQDLSYRMKAGEMYIWLDAFSRGLFFVQDNTTRTRPQDETLISMAPCGMKELHRRRIGLSDISFWYDPTNDPFPYVVFSNGFKVAELRTKVDGQAQFDYTCNSLSLRESEIAEAAHRNTTTVS